MQTTQLKITGMSCEACAAHVKKALESVAGVRSAEVDLKTQQAVVQHENANEIKLAAAVVEEGYDAQIAR